MSHIVNSSASLPYTPTGKNGYPARPATDTILNGFFTVDQKWIVQTWNKAAEILLDVPEKDIVGKNLWEEFAGSLPVNFYTYYQKAFLKDIPVRFNEYWAEKDSWFDVITHFSKDVLSVSFKSNNKSAQEVRTEQQLEILNELYRFVTEITSDCLWEWNFQNREIFWIDGGHKRVFGYSIENALISQDFWESCLHPGDKDRLLKKVDKIIKEGPGTCWEEEYRFRKLDGSYAYVHDRGRIIYDEDKKAVRMVGATQDISERKAIERQLSESERKLALIAKQTVNAVIITNAEDKITWVNSAFSLITGYGSEEVMGRTPGSFLQGEETDPSTIRYLQDMIKDKQPFECNIINYNKSGQKFWMHVQGQPMLGADGENERYFTIESDITEKILTEAKLTQDKLERQQEIDDAVMVAHESERAEIGKELQENLNQILSATRLYIELAKTDEENQGLYLDKSSSYILDVIEEIRKISKVLVTPGIHLIGLFESIKTLIEDLVMADPVKIEFHCEEWDEKELDEKLQLTIFKIVQEQMNNILRHAKATLVTITLTKQDEEIRLLISDNGNGHDLSLKNKGTGLVDIKHRADSYRGTVSIVSKPGQGYALKVILVRKNKRLAENDLFQLANAPVDLQPPVQLLRSWSRQKVGQQQPGQFMMALAHEIRNPLTNVNLAVELLSLLIKDDEQRQYLDIVMRGSVRINDLVTDMLVYCQTTEMRSETYSIHQMLDEVLAMAEDRILLRNITLSNDYISPDYKIVVDKKSVQIALTNIIINALEAMPADGGILKITTRSTNGKVQVEIKDNGTGIDEKDLKNIFKPNFTGRVGGMGIGLSATMNILLLNHVGLEVQSVKGSGTSFILSFDL